MKMKNVLLASALTILAVFSSGTALAAAQTMPMGKHHAGMKCETCHTKANALKGNQFVVPDDKTCEGCHGSYASLREKTKGGSEPNPHHSAHFGDTLSCTACHKQHSEPKSYCNNCHDFKHKMP